MSCGRHFSLVLDEAGTVFSCGKGESGELGRSGVRNSYTFGRVMEGVRQISAGKDHCLALIGPKTYGWGNSRDGQLGLLNTRQYFAPQ